MKQRIVGRGGDRESQRLQQQLWQSDLVKARRVLLPSGQYVGKLQVAKCKVMTSAQKPLWLCFAAADDPVY